MLRLIMLAVTTAGLNMATVAETEKSHKPSTSTVVKRFWAACVDEIEVPPADGFYRIRHFGNNQAISRVIMDLIEKGKKVGTFTSPWIYQGIRNKTPVVGGYTLVTDYEGKPGLLLRTTATKMLPFNEITEDETRLDGPAVRPLDAWRRVHWAYFQRELEPRSMEPTEEMPVTVEEFELVCTATDAAPQKQNDAP